MSILFHHFGVHMPNFMEIYGHWALYDLTICLSFYKNAEHKVITHNCDIDQVKQNMRGKA